MVESDSGAERRAWIALGNQTTMGEIMPVTTADKRTMFRKMHEAGCFALPNPWDVGSARALQHIGFKALASTSAGFAWAIENPTTASRWKRCWSISPRCAARSICRSMPISRAALPISPRKSAPHGRARAVKTGIAGLSIEDSTGDAAKARCMSAISRLLASRRPRAAIDADGSGVLLTGRCEGFLVGQGRSRPGDRSAQGLFGCRRGLSLCARHQNPRADHGRS